MTASEQPIRWGIAATGHIAQRFVAGLRQLPDADVAAVASRTAERAEAFGAAYDIPRRHGSYQALADDPDVDAVYVASPHARHEPDTLTFLSAGKPVLCEKPFALDDVQARRMVEAARSRGLFLMEAMWSRFLPAYGALRDLLAAGRIGEPQFVEADFGFRRPYDPRHRLFDRALGGGALLDLGIYPAQLAAMVFGNPDGIAAQAHLGESGVDEAVAAVLHHPGGGLAVLKAAIRVEMTCTARISGAHGWIELPAFMHCPDHLLVSTAPGVPPERIDCSWEGEGLRFQAVAVHDCLRAGRTESPIMPLDETVALAATLTAIRAEIGLTYPGD
jgi:predicted dehydrogenase